MNPQEWIIIIAAQVFTGWIISFLTIRLVLSAMFKKNWQVKLGAAVRDEFVKADIFEDHMSNESLFSRLKPEIENHVDVFLNEKLALIFPLLYKFMGEKTLSQFKTAFMVEIDLLFPVIIKSYMAAVKKEIRLDVIISKKIETSSSSILKRYFLTHLKKEILYFRLACVTIGLLCGILTVVILSFGW